MKKSSLCILVLVVIAAMLTMSSAALAVSWSAAVTEGVTAVDSSLDEITNTYTWTLNNMSSTPFSPVADHVLVWTLQPFNVYEMVSYTAPTGWEWKDTGWEYYNIENASEKYYTPPAIAPGEALTFTYTFDPNSFRINPFGSGYMGDPDAIGFISHVSAVVPGSGSLDGTVKWIETASPMYGDTWFDRSEDYFDVIPEPASIMGLGTLTTTLAATFLRRRRNS